MKLLLDQGVPRRAAAVLRELGISAVHTAEVELSRATDAEILTYCVQHHMTRVTLDADLHSLVALSSHSGPSVIRVRREGLTGPDFGRLLFAVASEHETILDRGALLTVEATRVRIRQLPISDMKTTSPPDR